MLAVAASARQTPPASRPLAITHVGVIDTAAGTLVADMTVVIRDGRIVSVEKSSGATPQGAEVVDGRNKFLMPGLWDMHVHLSYARASALPAFVANGVTSVRDMGSDLAELDRWRAQIADDVLVGPSIVRAGPILNGREFNRYQLAIADAAEARMAVRALAKVGVDVIKTHRQTSREAYFAVADEAKKLRLPFSGHVPVTVSPADASDAGPASIEHTETLFEGTFATEHAGGHLLAEIERWRSTEAPALFERFVRNGTAVDPTLIAQTYMLRLLEAGTPDPQARYIAASARQEGDKMLTQEARSVLLSRGPTLRELQKVTALMNRAGVTLLTGTDTSVLHPPGFTLHAELALLVESGLTPAQALRASTVNPARLFPAQESGTIAPGKRADVVLLDANPLDDIRNSQRINAVVLRGRFLHRAALDRLLTEAARLAAGS